MKRLLAFLALLALLVVVPASARADDDDDTPGYHRRDPLVGGLMYVGRIGAAIPAGKVGDNVDLSDLMSPQLSFDFALLARPTRWLRAGGYFGVAIGVPEGYFSRTCGATHCEAGRVRLGVEVSARLSSSQSWTPWIGAGLGLAVTLMDETNPDTLEILRTMSFWSADLLRVMVGLDGTIDHDLALGLGPYLEVGVGRTFDSSGRIGSVDYDRPLGAPGTHVWVELGIQGTFGK